MDRRLTVVCFLSALVGLSLFLLSSSTPWHAKAQSPDPLSVESEQAFGRPIYSVLERSVHPEFGHQSLALQTTQIVLNEFRDPNTTMVYSYLVPYSGWHIFRTTDGNDLVRTTYDFTYNLYARLNRSVTSIVLAAGLSTTSLNIHRMNLDGTDRIELTETPWDDLRPVWSFDGARIYFESYRNGNGDIYVMNADGSGQVRITDWAGYDGMPAISPDGTKIAFASNRSGGYRIYTMNLDGSNLRQLSSQPYSAYPVWSPDGSQIAYAADDNLDGWLDLWLMDADGSNQHIVYGGFQWSADFIPTTWAPDGSSIVLTIYIWIYHNNNWYIENVTLTAKRFDRDEIVRVTSSLNDFEGFGDWRTQDLTPPTSILQNIPGESPYLIDLYWSGQDNYQVRHYDLQIRDGAGAAWSDLLVKTTLTELQYQGQGGRMYAFRVRAVDKHFNVQPWETAPTRITRVESLAPITTFRSLPPFIRFPALLNWTGWDYGGSGIAYFDLEKRSPDGSSWQPLLSGTTNNSFTYYGTPGETVEFRVRGVDRAGNVEAWNQHNLSQTTFYNWKQVGFATDNTGTPLQVNLENITPAPFLATGEMDGWFGFYQAGAPTSFNLEAGKTGYLDISFQQVLPSERFPLRVVLPPGENLVEDWGFEMGGFGANWEPGGSLAPAITDRAAHSGDYGLQLGHIPDHPYMAVEQIFELEKAPVRSALLYDEQGRRHFIYVEEDSANGHNRLYYRRKSNGIWSDPTLVVDSTLPIRSVGAITDLQQNLHLVWRENAIPTEHFYHRILRPSGSWSSPERFASGYGGPVDNGQVKLQMTSDGTLHIAYMTNNRVKVVSRTPVGRWIDSYNFTADHINDFLLDSDQRLHLLMDAYQELSYATMAYETNWKVEYDILPAGFSFIRENTSKISMAIDHGEQPVVVGWMNDSLCLLSRDPTSGWGWPVCLASSVGEYGYQAVFSDASGTIHIIYTSNLSTTVRYVQYRDGAFTTPISLDTAGCTGVSTAYMDVFENIHVIKRIDGACHVWKRAGSDQWATNLFESGITGSPHIIFAENAAGELAIQGENLNGIYEFFPATAESPGQSWVQQTLQIPVGLDWPVLSLVYRMGGASAAHGTGLLVRVVGDDQTMLEHTITNNQAAWAHAWVDLRELGSQPVTLTIHTQQAAGAPWVWADVDEVTLGQAYTDVWVELQPGVQYASPGDEVQLVCQYGNRGFADAAGNELQMQLPGALEFISASIPPDGTSPQLYWTLSALPGRVGAGSITVQARVRPGALMGQWVLPGCTINYQCRRR
jgi:hypothetical protein